MRNFLDSPVNPYQHINEQLAEDSAFLWLLRTIAVDYFQLLQKEHLLI